MDYNHQPVTALLRGPLIRTPQGLIVIAFSVAYLFAAVLVGIFGITPPSGWSSNGFVGLCVGWPVLLFLYFVRDGHPNFLPSLSGAALLACCGLAPLLFKAYENWLT